MLHLEAELLALLEYEKSINSIFDRCFEKQKAAALHRSKRKVIRCSRRAGKTELAATKLIQSAQSSPNGICLYVALTRKSAKKLLWNRLKRMLQELGASFVPSESDLILKFQNGSEIWLAGANQEDVAETLRGHSYRVVILDECASFRGHIDELIEEILEPALIDEDGELWIMGTPSWDFSSYFYKANHNPAEWDSFHWTLFDNPHIPNAKTWVDDLKRRRGWSDENPILLREYYGLWIKTMEQMVYLFNPLRNVFASLPELHHNVLGVDLGFEDKMAFSVVSHQEHSPVAYVRHSERHHHMLIHDMAQRIQKFQAEFQIHKVVIDEGGLGKSIAEELRQRYHINCQAAQKQNKRAYIELFNSELREGRILVAEDNPIIKEWNTLIWDDESKKVEKPGLANDVSDATLYAWRESFYYAEQPIPQKPKFGSQEFFEQEERRMLEESMNQAQSQTSWW